MPVSTTNLIVGFDPTSAAQVTGAQLAQMVSASTMYLDKGLCILTTDTAGVPDLPDAATHPEFKRCIWLRWSPASNSVAAYVWNPYQLYNMSYTVGGVTTVVTTNWNPLNAALLPAKSIQGYMIADGAITSTQVTSIDVSQVSGLNLTSYVKTTDAPTAGDISGTFSAGFSINGLKVTGAMIKQDGVNGIITANINPKQVTYDKIAGTATSGQILQSDGASGVAWQTRVINNLANPVNVTDDLKIIQASAGAYALVAPTTVGRILQSTFASTTTEYADTGAKAPGAIVGNDGTAVTGLNISNFIPKNAASTLKIRVTGSIKKITNSGFAVIGLWKKATGGSIAADAPIAIKALNFGSSSSVINNISLETSTAAGGVTGLDFFVRVLGSTNGTTFNANSGYTPESNATIEITEYL